VTTIVTPDRKLETGHTRQGEPPGTGDRRKGLDGGGISPDAEVEGHASTGGMGASSEIPGPAGSWGREAPDVLRWQVVQLDATPRASPRLVFAPLTFAARRS